MNSAGSAYQFIVLESSTGIYLPFTNLGPGWVILVSPVFCDTEWQDAQDDMKLSAVAHMLGQANWRAEREKRVSPGPFNRPFQPQLGRAPAKEIRRVSASGFIQDSAGLEPMSKAA